MIRLFQRLLLFSGLQKKCLIRSFLAYLVSSFFEMIPIMAILTVLTGILKQLSGDVMPESTIWISLGIMIVSIVGRIVFVNLSANARTLGSFAFGSEKRMEIGERLKRAPMGYFNENRLGDITAAVTTTLGDLEQQSVTIMENVAGGFIHAIVIGVWLMIYEWRIGLISLAGLAVALYRQGRQEARAPPSGSPGWPGHCRFGICAGHGRSQGVWAGGTHRKSS